MITLVEGFQVFERGSKIESLALESDRISEYMEYFTHKQFRYLFISSSHGFKTSNLSFLEKYPDVEGLYLFSPDFDVSGMYSLKNLKFLIFALDKKKEIDLGHFRRLETAIFSWKHSISNLASCSNLRELHIRDLSSVSDDLSELPELSELIYLKLIQAKIKSLTGLSRFRKLKKLELHYLSKLTTLTGIEKTSQTLQDLSINSCKKIEDHSLVSSLKELQELAFNDCGVIPSISFIRNVPKLKTFRFVDTTVRDGDLSPCQGLNKVKFTNKRHYSHTESQFEK